MERTTMRSGVQNRSTISYSKSRTRVTKVRIWV